MDRNKEERSEGLRDEWDAWYSQRPDDNSPEFAEWSAREPQREPSEWLSKHNALMAQWEREHQAVIAEIRAQAPEYDWDRDPKEWAAWYSQMPADMHSPEFAEWSAREPHSESHEGQLVSVEERRRSVTRNREDGEATLKALKAREARARTGRFVGVVAVLALMFFWGYHARDGEVSSLRIRQESACNSKTPVFDSQAQARAWGKWTLDDLDAAEEYMNVGNWEMAYSSAFDKGWHGGWADGLDYGYAMEHDLICERLGQERPFVSRQTQVQSPAPAPTPDLPLDDRTPEEVNYGSR